MDSEINGEKFKELCLNKNENEIKKLFDNLFDPDKDLDVSEKTFNLVKKYITGGADYNDFKNDIKKYDSSIICGFVHKKGELGYMCKTCENVNTMFLCMKCFQNGNHEGHEYYLIRCEDGATCDCGIPELLAESGFCKDHGACHQKDINAPKELTVCFEVVFSHLIYRLVQELRISGHIGGKPLGTYFASLLSYKRYVEPYVDLFNDLCSHSTATRKIILDYIMDPDYYKKKILEDEARVAPKSYIHKIFTQKLSQTKAISYPNSLKQKIDISKRKYETLLDELLFWSVEYLLPHPLCRFFENLLPDLLNNEERCLKFVGAFSFEYLHIAYISSQTEEQLNQQIGCQLFNNPTIAKKAVLNCNAFKILLTSFYINFTEQKAFKANNKQKTGQKSCVHLNFENASLRKCVYFSQVVDMSYLTNHFDNVKYFIEDDEILSTWLELVSYFQCVNNFKRQFGIHVEYESLVAYSGFISEWEFCSVIMWSLIQHLNDESSKYLTLKAINRTLSSLKNWFQALSKHDLIKLSNNYLSFHIPLNRYYSILLYNAIYKQNCSLAEVFNHDEATLMNLYAHPLQIHAGFHEIQANIWVKNGTQLKESVIYYTRNDFCRSYIDADLFLMQIVATRLDAEIFVKQLFKRFYVYEYCSLSKSGFEGSLFYTFDDIQKTTMMTSALIFLAELVTIRPHLRLQNAELARQEIVDLACIGNFTHSELKKYVPSTYNWGTSMTRVDLDKIIKEVAECNEPTLNDIIGELKQTKYTARGQIWENEYDPLFTYYRSIQLSEFQDSLNRYSNYIKLKKLFDQPEKLWPPLRLPNHIFEDQVLRETMNILNSKTLHAIIFVLLHKRLNSDNFSEKLFYFAFYILDLIVHINEKNETKADNQTMQDSSDKEFVDGRFELWFPTNNIFRNLCIKIPHILYDNKSTNDDSADNNEFAKYLFNPARNNSDAFQKLEVNESMISLLVKILYKIGESRDFFDSYKEHRIYEPGKVNGSRIGDEYYFIKNLLNKVASLNVDCKNEIQRALDSLDIKQVVENVDEIKEKKPKSADIKARHQRFMEKMLSKQVKFLSNYQFQESVDESNINKTMGNYNYPLEHEHECCICRSKSKETVERPIGLLSLIRPTNILRYRETTKIERKIPLSDESLLESNKTSYKVENKRIELLKSEFDVKSCIYAINSVWTNNVFTQTCGHYVHFDCYFEYLKSKKQSPNEYNCPLCEQLSNCLLPIQKSNVKNDEKLDMETYLTDIEAFNAYCNSYSTYSSVLNALKEEFVIDAQTLRKIVPCISEVLTILFRMPPFDTRILSTTENKNLNIPYYFINTEDTILFLVAILRNQLEIAFLVNEECNGIRRSYFLPLFQVLSFRMKVLCDDKKPHVKKWLMLTSPSKLPENSDESEIPLLLCDPTTIFLTIILNCPSKLHRLTYQTIVNAYFNLVYIQSILKVMLKKKTQSTDSNLTETHFGSINDYTSFIRNKLGTEYFERTDDEIEKIFSLEGLNLNNETENIEALCLPCLQLASVLQSYLYGESFQHDNFDALIEYLHIDYKKSKETKHELLDWRGEEPSNILNPWLDELKQLAEKKKQLTQSLIILNNVPYLQPTLIQLPVNYMELYFHYTQKKCTFCTKIPTVTMVCLVCGKNISICCEAMNNFDIQHAEQCAIGSRLYINIQTTNVVIIKKVDQKLKAGIWGTLYLDEHGEEDVELKRGRPLYLCQRRYNLLKLQWFSHILEYKRLLDV